MLLGALGLTYFKKKASLPSNHKLLMFSTLLIRISSFFFVFIRSKFYQGCFIFLGSIALMILDVEINISVINITEKGLIEFWLQMVWGIFSVGAILTPFLVFLFAQNTYIIIFILSSLNSIIYYFLTNS